MIPSVRDPDVPVETAQRSGSAARLAFRLLLALGLGSLIATGVLAYRHWSYDQGITESSRVILVSLTAKASASLDDMVRETTSAADAIALRTLRVRSGAATVFCVLREAGRPADVRPGRRDLRLHAAGARVVFRASSLQNTFILDDLPLDIDRLRWQLILVAVPTGVFIESAHFSSPNDLSVTGYLWQKYTVGAHDSLSRGFTIAEATDVDVSENYRTHDRGFEIVRWRVHLLLSSMT